MEMQETQMTLPTGTGSEDTQGNTVEVRFETDLLPLFEQRFTKAAKKYAKVGQELRIISQRTEMTNHSTGILGFDFDEEVSVTYITINRPEIHVRPGVEFWGTISLADGTKTVYRTAACPEDLVLSELELTCDHCNTNRRRKKYFIFQEDGRLMRLGSTCVQPYYGLDLERILRTFDGIMADLEAPVESCGGRVDIGWSLTELMIATEFITNYSGGRWIPQSQALNREPSSSAIRSLLIDCTKFPHKPEVKKFEAYCKGLDRGKGKDLSAILIEKYSKPQDDFGWNIYNNLYVEDEDGTRRLRNRIPSKASGLICFAIFQAIHGDYRKKEKSQEVESGEKGQKPQSIHVGLKGDRLTMRVKVMTVREIANDWGDALMLGFEDESGNQFRWFASSESSRTWEPLAESGEFIVIKGTVKKHTEYKGLAQTVLNRVVIL